MIKQRAIYGPYGEKSATVTPGVVVEDKGWIGQRYDAEAGLQYLNARYYDPELGMFLQPDWFEVTMPGVGTNRYAYGLGDPVNLSDPGRNFAFLGLAGCVSGACQAAAYGIGLAALGYLGYAATQDGAGSIISTPIDDYDIGPESIPIDPTAGEPTILSNPMGDDPWNNLEGMSANTDTGPSIVSTPATGQEIWSNVVEARPLREALGLSPNDGVIAHHNIPDQHRNHPAVEAAIRSGYKFDGAMNGTKVSGQQGGHPNYNGRIGRELDRLQKDGQKAGWTDAQYREKIQEISDRERDRIDREGGYVYDH